MMFGTLTRLDSSSRSSTHAQMGFLATDQSCLLPVEAAARHRHVSLSRTQEERRRLVLASAAVPRHL